LERLRIEAEKGKRRLSSVPQVAVKLQGAGDGRWGDDDGY
jgi:molecular chaperone DnaK (HSP70)